MKRRRCPWCHKIAVMQTNQVCCSRSCAGKRLANKDIPSMKRRALLAGAANARVARAKRDAKYQKMIDILGPIRACQYAYKAGYTTGHRARRYPELQEEARERLARKRLEQGKEEAA